MYFCWCSFITQPPDNMCSMLRNCVCCCCCCVPEDVSDDESHDQSGRLKIATACCCVSDDGSDEINSNKCVSVHHSCLSYIFPRLMGRIVDKTDRKPVLLVAGRRVPRNRCYRIQVYAYLTVMAFLTGLWFLVTLLEQVIYHSVTSCSEIGPDDRYYVCFNHSANWSTVDCQTVMVGNHTTESILCYTYSITPSAFAVAFSMASFISTIVSITFHSAIYCSDERCSRRGLIVIQFMFVLIIIFCVITVGILYISEERTSLTNYFLDERAPLRGVLVALFGVSLLIGSCLPWAPFQSKRNYDTVAIEHPYNML